MALEGALGFVAGAALLLLVIYYFYGFLHRAFQRVGFTQQEASLIILGTIIGGFINVPIVEVGGRILAFNVGGALVPVVVTWMLFKRFPAIRFEAAIGITLVAVATWLVTRATPEGIVSPFPLYLFPPLVAALVSVIAFWREEEHSAPLAYVSGSMGALIGADVLRLDEFLAQPVANGGVASIGGAAVFDMVFLAGVIAVGLDMLLFRERRRSGMAEQDENVVFRTTTSSEFIRDYVPVHRAREPARQSQPPRTPAGRSPPEIQRIDLRRRL